MGRDCRGGVVFLFQQAMSDRVTQASTRVRPMQTGRRFMKYGWVPVIVTALVGAIVFVWYEQYQSGKYQRITLAGRSNAS